MERLLNSSELKKAGDTDYKVSPFLFEEVLMLYVYDGPVLVYGICVANHWHSSTNAPSEKKAINNLKHQYNMLTGKKPNNYVELPGKLKIINGEENIVNE